MGEHMGGGRRADRCYHGFLIVATITPKRSGWDRNADAGEIYFRGTSRQTRC